MDLESSLNGEPEDFLMDWVWAARKQGEERNLEEHPTSSLHTWVKSDVLLLMGELRTTLWWGRDSVKG